MPYITQERRKALACLDSPKDEGELNYAITRMFLDYITDQSQQKSMWRNYAMFNKLVGVLECVKLEFYRRMVVSYEEEKVEENGDVFPTGQVGDPQ